MSQYFNDVRNHIEKVLNRMCVKENNMEVAAGSSHGDNYMGVIAKVVIKAEEKNGKPSRLTFIVKSAPTNEGFRAFLQVRIAFCREIYIYTKVFPIFTKLQEEKIILKPFKSFPKYYGSSIEEYKEALVMEDLKELGFSLCDRRQPLHYNHVKLVMREYGKLHAISYALRDQKPEVFEELAENTKDTFFKNLNFSEVRKNSLRAATQNALLSLDPVEDKEACNKFKNLQDDMFEKMAEVIKSEPAGKYAVITHGDCWMNNILFSYKNSLNPESPTDVRLIDWQLSRLASPVLDLSYFIFTCTDKALRDAHYDDMIEEYYDSLKSFLMELGSDPEDMFPFKVLQEHLKKFSRYGLHMAVLVLYLMTSEGDEIPDLNTVENVEGFRLLGFKSRNLDKYKERIRAVILDFVKFGYEF